MFGVELFVKGDEVWFSEVSPRPHDTGMVTHGDAGAERVRTARARHPRPAGQHGAARAGRLGRDLRQLDAQGIAFEGVAEALAVPDTDLRLFGKPESFARRRMGVALATADDIETARERALAAAAKVKPIPAPL